MLIFNHVYKKSKAKYTCLQKSAFVLRTMEATVEPPSLILILHYLLFS